MSACNLCPRRCGVERQAGEIGFCGQGNEIRIARAALHHFEEPPISGTRGSGTVFFVGCSLGCVFCQNKAISRAEQVVGRTVTPAALADVFLSLQEEGAHNINLVTPTHFANGVIEALTLARPKLAIPVVYNSSGYERVETLRRLAGLVDIYLPDFKYASAELADRYSAAPDYPEVTSAALSEMFRQVGRYKIGENGIMRRGMIVRHLVLPKGRQDSMAVLDRLAELLPASGILLSLMSQYTPTFAMDSPFAELHRKVTTFEYRSVVDHALSLCFDGFMQDKSAATASYTPNF